MSQEEALGWIEALKTLIPKRVAPSVPVPAPPPQPPPSVEDPCYETVPEFTKKPDYEEINPASLNAPTSYADPTVKEIPSLNDAYGQDVDRKRAATPIIVEEKVADDTKPEFTARPKREEQDRSEKKLSRSYSDEQMGRVLEMLEQVMQVEGMKEKAQNLYDDIAFGHPSHPREKVYGRQDTSHYVDMDTIDVSDLPKHDVAYDTVQDSPQHDGSTYDVIQDPPTHEEFTYDTIQDSPVHGTPPKHLYSNIAESPTHFYQNLHTAPPLPPKPFGKSPSHKMVPKARTRKKPEVSPRRNLLSQHQTKQVSFDDLLAASSKVTTDLLVLNDNGDDEDDSDLYVQHTLPHRPEWAKASMTVTPNTELDKYGLEDEMLSLLTLDTSHLHDHVAFASGQFGDVYKAILDTGEGKGVEVAIKSVKHETEKEKQDFVREMSVMSKMLHPNIIRLYGLVLKKNLIVLEYMHYGDLGTFLKKNKRSVSKLIMYMMDISLGMHHVSTLGLVHRDLAARNVLVSQNETCKVADFGLLRALDNGCYLLTGASKVPIRWCAPECLKHRKFYPASDVWSYGIVMWEMAHPTEVPYKDSYDYDVAHEIVRGEKMDIPKHYPETVQQIMQACWCYKPDKRPSFQYITILLTKLAFSR